jgi:hypothetical protein
MALIVISSYNMPSAVNLQIACLKKYNPGHSIIVIDDLSSRSYDIRNVCENSGVMCYTMPHRMGHYLGAQQSYFLGMALAGAYPQIPNICCISQRFMVTKPGWVSEGEVLLGNRAVLYGEERYPGNPNIGARTECIMFNTSMWIYSGNYVHFCPKSKSPGTIEERLMAVIKDFIHTDHRVIWEFLGNNRLDFSKSCDWFSPHLLRLERSGGKFTSRFQNLAELLNVKLKDDFSIDSFYEIQGSNYLG